ncbi:MAG: phosphate acyltransferase [Clostridia bacterium]|nr:phosphate acyltransferase [Clostridia bacterium]
MLFTIDQIIERARAERTQTLAVAAAHDEDVLTAVDLAAKDGLCRPILIGVRDEILRLLPAAAEYEIIDADSDEDCAKKAVALVRNGVAGCLMKGFLPTGALIKAALNKEEGIRTERLLSHVMVYEAAGYGKLIFNTDGGINVAPNLEQKAQILENAAIMLKALGYESMTTACVCGAETVNEKIQATVDAAALAQMTDRYKAYNMRIFGPVGLDLAISREACRHKRYTAEGAGEADILLFPNYEAGNCMGKTLTYFAKAKSAGVVMGARVPIVLTSRADTAQTKKASIALGCIVGGRA